MSTLYFLLCSLLLLHLSTAAKNQSHTCHEQESSALLDFKQTLNISRDCSGIRSYYCDDSNKLESWNPEINCCDWGGLICHNGHVISLNLSITCACGSSATNITLLLHRLPHLRELCLDSIDFENSPAAIPTTISNSLRFLDLSNCNLNGELPVTIFEFPKLEHLDLSYNGNLRGRFPGYFNRSSPLTMLRISATSFSGEFPASLGNLRSLSHFDISFCDFRGLIPSSSLGNLTGKLRYLSLQGNYFRGQIPCFPSHLTTLSLYRNLFAGKIPYSIGNLTRLTELDLSYNQLTGVIPSFLANLDRLKRLSLSFNQLTGPIPSSSFTNNLDYLSLASNMLTGPIPNSIDNLNYLRSLYLGSNKLTGLIPLQLGNLTRLEYLDLSSNRFTGSIPDLTRLSNLTLLDLSSNNLEGTLGFFTTFSHFQTLFMLYLLFNNELSLVFEPGMNVTHDKFLLLGLASCNLSEFPQFLQDQDQLDLLDLSYNNLSGLVPMWLLSSPSLYTLNLSGNSLIWPVSFNSTRMSLGVLDLRSSGLHGSLPDPPLYIEVYLVSDNRLSGEIPESVCNVSRLRRLDLAKNDFSGAIPQCLMDMTSNNVLSILSLSNNNLDGTIPDLLSTGNHSCKLRMMDVSDNRLRGPLPRSLLSSCNELEFLNVGNNSIYDTFPAWLGSLANLRVLILRSNRFHGAIDELEDNWFPKLQVIDISHNSFGGFLPSKYFRNWKAMRRVSDDEDGAKYIGESVYPYIILFQTPDVLEFDYSMTINNKGMEMVYSKILNYFIAIDFSSNNFTGEIPESVRLLARLRLLNLSNNALTGHIPVFLKDLAHLEALDLSRNELSGEIPQQLMEISSLLFFNVSYNRLSGHIPRGKQFNTFQNDSYIGNLGLCGDPLSEECGGRTTPPSDEAEGSYFELEWPIVLMGVVSGLVVGVVMGLVVPIKRNNWFVWKISEFVRARLAR